MFQCIIKNETKFLHRGFIVIVQDNILKISSESNANWIPDSC